MFFTPVSLNLSSTPLGQGQRESVLFDSIEKIEAYLKQHGPFQTLSSTGPHSYTQLPEEHVVGDKTYHYWIQGASRTSDPSLRLMEVVGTVSALGATAVCYQVPSSPQKYLVSYQRFFQSLADQNPDYQVLLTIDVSSIPSYASLAKQFLQDSENLDLSELLGRVQESKTRVPLSLEGTPLKMMGQRFFDQFYKETQDAMLAGLLLKNVHAALPVERKDAIERVWDGVGVGNYSQRDRHNWRWDS